MVEEILLHNILEKEFHEIRKRLMGIGLWGRYRLPSREVVEDLVGETYTKLLDKKNKSFESRTDAYAYIATTFYNCRTDYYRKRQTEKDAIKKYFERIKEQLRLIIETNPHDLLGHYPPEEILDIVARIYKDISPKCKEIFELLYEEEMDRNRAREILGISKEALENRVYNCRQRLKMKLKGIL